MYPYILVIIVIWIAEAIKTFSDGPLDATNEKDSNLKCYMRCFYTDLLKYEWSHEADVEQWFTEAEIDALLAMDDQCAHLSYETDDETCESAYIVVKCFKEANPAVRHNLFKTKRTCACVNRTYDIISFSVFLPAIASRLLNGWNNNVWASRRH